MTRRVLMVAYHFPPISGSSGMQRTLKFCQYLGDFGWQPTVLTIAPKAYPATSDAQLAEIPASVQVVRCRGVRSEKVSFLVRASWIMATRSWRTSTKRAEASAAR